MSEHLLSVDTEVYSSGGFESLERYVLYDLSKVDVIAITKVFPS